MKGVVLAGGKGTRLGNLTRATNKHLLPVGTKPMIFHPIEKLVSAGIRDILIVTGTEHMGSVVNSLGSGKDFDCEFTYKVQDEAGGIAQALGLAHHFAGFEKFVVILGDNIFEDDITDFVNEFRKQPAGGKIILKDVEDPQRYGVVEFGDEDEIVSIEEKPEKPRSSFCVTGIYMYDHNIFHIIDTLKPSGRGELEITDVNKILMGRKQLSYGELKGWWTDAGTPESYLLANQLVSNLKT